MGVGVGGGMGCVMSLPLGLGIPSKMPLSLSEHDLSFGQTLVS